MQQPISQPKKKTRIQRFFDWVHRVLVRIHNFIRITVVVLSVGIAAILASSFYTGLSPEVSKLALIATVTAFVLYGISFDTTDVSKKRALVKYVEEGFAHSEAVTFETYESMGGDVFRNWKSRIYSAFLGGAFIIFANRAEIWTTAWSFAVNYFSHLVP